MKDAPTTASFPAVPGLDLKAEEDRVNKALQEAAAKAQDTSPAQAQGTELADGHSAANPAVKLTGNTSLPEDFPAAAALKDAGLYTLGNVADHDFDAQPVDGVSPLTRTDIAAYLAKPSVDLDA